ncbi:hypothetical protein BGZ67_005186 [Mortierella alpina]|nr:hypothetical protein BGZ67_005186 [Mortierella alpina]
MLTQHNLSKHTERHHQLNEKRDFVEEYLDSLDLSALNPSCPSIRARARARQDKAKRRGTRSKLEQHSADEASAAKQHSRKTQESKSTLIESTKRRDSLMTSRQDETKSSKRRRQYVEAVELEVQNLDINESDSSKTALRKRKGRPVRAGVKTRSLAPAKQGTGSSGQLPMS